MLSNFISKFVNVCGVRSLDLFDALRFDLFCHWIFKFLRVHGDNLILAAVIWIIECLRPNCVIVGLSALKVAIHVARG